jgi:hypothetical protein
MNEDLLKDEEKKIRRLRFLVDLAEAVLIQSDLSMKECLDLIGNTKRAALGLFPDKESVYDRVYAPRFGRIIHERFTIPGSPSGRN